ncbi:alpha,alpha-trehalase TreF [Stakelama saccharophila]|uniref:Alpha,alpha-trehalase TreF n=1 Tax=Stakelama saccharophila TaxID=3075605 RepID=A0ABZ0B9U7_9SPHN|nr:alpha,alpha-trehalase TreF [Stakelama sp. W311]WNO53896.1 alpha,alpha-trehalase TreF [Stakelama sp. W311]
MRHWHAGLAALALSALQSCADLPPPQASERPTTGVAQVLTPEDRFGDLFRAVQMRRIFRDGKTFVDAIPRRDSAAIVADYEARDDWSDAELRRFVLANFEVPEESAPAQPLGRGTHPAIPITEHIANLWSHLTRQPVQREPGSSQLAVPKRFVVPGGRFREMYYWDSYFTLLGAKADGHPDLVEAMIADFSQLVDRFGHVPNGTRTYYVSRSQPPVLWLMMGLSDATDRPTLERRLEILKREHAFWMRGRDDVSEETPTAAHVVRMADGSILNRYWDMRDTPRDESYREDVLTARASDRPSEQVYRDLRAAAESGWDFSSRWLPDDHSLGSIETTNIVPVDLNALLYGLEMDIARRCAALGEDCAADYRTQAEARRAAVERWLWNEERGAYGDWNLRERQLQPEVTAATAYPLFTGLASDAHADRVARTIRHLLLAPGGLRTTRVETGEQWDAPNGWAPLQWIAVAGLRKTGHEALAREIATRFLATVVREYRASGKLVEKYDVEKVRPGGGGEYPLQDGFGWTNGVTRALIGEYGMPDMTKDLQ